jgi:hypothetical protein
MPYTSNECAPEGKKNRRRETIYIKTPKLLISYLLFLKKNKPSLPSKATQPFDQDIPLIKVFLSYIPISRKNRESEGISAAN